MHKLPAEPSTILVSGFVLLPLFLITVLAVALKSWKVMVAGIFWAAGTGAAASTGLLADFSSQPPPMFVLLACSVVLVIAVGLSRLGESLAKLPLSLIIGFLSFRIIVELLMHRAVSEGVAPPQMSWEGQNFDIVAGVTALLLAPLASRCATWCLLGWNSIALGLLLWTVSVAIRSLPIPIQQLEPDGVWIAFFPFVWLPSILVGLALLAHLVLYRKLLFHSAIQ